MNLDVAGVKAGLLLIPAAFAALSFLAVKAWRGMRRAVRLSDAIMLIIPKLEALAATVDTLRKEVHPNHGKHLGEAVHEIKEMAESAAQKAADVAAEMEGLSADVGRFHSDARERADVAGRERRGVQESLNVLLLALSDFADERHKRENAYVGALARLGIDLTNVTQELELEARGDER